VQVFEFINQGDSSHIEEFNQKFVRSEQQLESWLHSHPRVLLDETVLIIGRQSDFGSGPIDLLALDQFGNTLIFELKKGDTATGSTSEDKIIGQPLRYAEAIGSCGYDELNETYQEYQTEIASGVWDLDESATLGEDLVEGFEITFGRSLDSTDFNEHQRIVVVAEHITRQTAANARYLLSEGLNVQCREIQLFSSAEEVSGSSMLAASTVVNYNPGRVRPERRGNPTYPEMNRELIERAFPETQEIVNATTYTEVFSKLDKRAPSLKTNHPEHPDSVDYCFQIAPATNGSVSVRMNVYSDDEALATIRKYAAEFEEQGFAVNQTRERYGVVNQSWNVEGVESLERDELLDEVAERYADLVKLGHEVLTEND
jgi:hypothetical protein